MSDRKVYTAEYKREAVRLAQESGNLGGTAHNLGINPTILQRWKKALQSDKPNPFPGQGNPADPELARLQRENVRLQEENEILKRRWVSSPVAHGEIPFCPRATAFSLDYGSVPSDASVCQRLLRLEETPAQ